jgi:hypothetical protein
LKFLFHVVINLMEFCSKRTLSAYMSSNNLIFLPNTIVNKNIINVLENYFRKGLIVFFYLRISKKLINKNKMKMIFFITKIVVLPLFSVFQVKLRPTSCGLKLWTSWPYNLLLRYFCERNLNNFAKFSHSANRCCM